MKCFPSAAAYHAYWRHHSYRRVIRAGWFVLCSVVASGVVGGVGTVIMGHPKPGMVDRYHCEAGYAASRCNTWSGAASLDAP